MNSRWLTPVLVAVLLILTSGCLVIPVKEKDSGVARRNITKEGLARLEPGISTRTAVLLTLGEPDAVSRDGSKFAYHQEKIVAYLFIFSSYGATGGPIMRQCYFVLNFDSSGNLKSWEPSRKLFIGSPEELFKRGTSSQRSITTGATQADKNDDAP